MASTSIEAAQEYRRIVTKAKRVVRTWEEQYKKEFNVKPDRAALKASPEEVRDSYKIYWKYKVKNDEANGVSFDSNKCIESPVSITSTEASSPGHSLFSSHNSSEPDPDQCHRPSWGQHLNKIESEKVKPKIKHAGPSLYSKMAENLRSGSIIKTRKSLNKRSTLNCSLSTLNIKSPTNPTKNICIEGLSNTSNHQEVVNNSPSLKKVINSPLLRKAKPSGSGQSPSLLKQTISPKESPLKIKKCIPDISTNSPVRELEKNELHLDFTDDLGCQMIEDCKAFKVHSISDVRSRNKNDFNLSKSVNCMSAFHELSNSKNKAPIKKYNKDWIARCEDLDCDDTNASDSGDSILCATPVKKKEINIIQKRLNKSSIGSPAKKIKLQLINKYDNQLQTYSSPIYHNVVPPDGADSEELAQTTNTRAALKKRNDTQKDKVCIPSENVGHDPPACSDGNKVFQTYDELCDIEQKENCVKYSKKYLTKEEKIKKKIDSGSLNENFVRINIEKKVYCRGKKHLSTKSYKLKEWKKKQNAKPSSNGGKNLTCFRCGDFGHWASQCPGKFSDQLMPNEEMDDCDGTFLTLDQAANLSRGVTQDSIPTKIYHPGRRSSQAEESIVADSAFDTSDLFSEYDLEELMGTSAKPRVDVSNSQEKAAMPPLYPLHEGEVTDTQKEVFDALKLFGHDSFKEGQEATIMRILSGQSTLLVLSTGSGKSLCYQLPAYILSQKQKCVALCISPLVSLMEDQVTGLPPCVNAVCLHTQQTPKNRDKALASLKSGNAHILIVSPEAITSSHSGGVMGTLMRDLPPISFACIDEAHCISQWSDNFRPAYLQVCKVLKEKLNVNTILGLTATAKHSTALSIAEHLGITDIERGIISGTSIPSNLNLSVSLDAVREAAILDMLNGDRFRECSSIIIYCTRRDQCDKTAAFLRTKLLQSSNINVKDNQKRGRAVSIDAEAYHAGLTAYRRGQVQKNFMSGKLRIVVATVAFGMGIDKSDVQGIIHYNMPQHIESYVQEIGRAGRDGTPAHAHLFLEPQQGHDVQELKRHIFSNSVDRFTVRKLLTKVLSPCPCIKLSTFQLRSNEGDSDLNDEVIDSYKCPHISREVAIPIASFVEELDIPEENIKTLLCYLELYPKSFLKIGHHVYNTCTVSCYKGPKQLCLVSRKCPALAAAIALQTADGVNFTNKSTIQFPVVEVAAVMGWKSSIVKQELKKLEWDFDGANYKKSGVKVDFSELAFHLEFSSKLNEEDQDEMLEYLFTRTNKREKDQLHQLLTTYQILHSVSVPSARRCSDEVDLEKSNSLKSQIKEYFDQNYVSSVKVIDQLYIRPEIEDRIRSSVRVILGTHRDNFWNGRAMARIFHGIGSPNFPARTWGRVRNLWRLYLDIDFNLLISIATKEILKLR